MLRWRFSDYSDSYIVVKRTVDVLANAENKNDKAEKKNSI